MLALLTLLAISIGQAVPDSPSSERRVRMELYASTGGDRWSNRSGWVPHVERARVNSAGISL